tara:strand:- start:2905 stop:3840 length:936 start_codon:yes stop_codon:yes gene_type:complete
MSRKYKPHCSKDSQGQYINNVGEKLLINYQKECPPYPGHISKKDGMLIDMCNQQKMTESQKFKWAEQFGKCAAFREIYSKKCMEKKDDGHNKFIRIMKENANSCMSIKKRQKYTEKKKKKSKLQSETQLKKNQETKILIKTNDQKINDSLLKLNKKLSNKIKKLSLANFKKSYKTIPIIRKTFFEPGVLVLTKNSKINNQYSKIDKEVILNIISDNKDIETLNPLQFENLYSKTIKDELKKELERKNKEKSKKNTTRKKKKKNPLDLKLIKISKQLTRKNKNNRGKKRKIKRRNSTRKIKSKRNRYNNKYK